MNEERFRELKKQVEEATAEADRAQGAQGQLLKRLQDEFDCPDVRSGKKLLNELEAKVQAAEKLYEKAEKEYLQKWKE